MPGDFRHHAFAVHAHTWGEVCINSALKRTVRPIPGVRGSYAGPKVATFNPRESPHLRQLPGPSCSRGAGLRLLRVPVSCSPATARARRHRGLTRGARKRAARPGNTNRSQKSNGSLRYALSQTGTQR